MRAVIKIGGSLFKEAPELVNRLIQEFNSENSMAVESRQAYGRLYSSILIVPGGGTFTDTVRSADRIFSFGADASHWMSILGMEQYAYYLQDKSGVVPTDSITDIPQGVSILFPYRLLKIEDPLPHTWDVTSDTIAAWVAKQVDAILLKATDVDGIFKEGKLMREISVTDFEGSCVSCIDPALLPFLQKNRMECLIVNGKYPGRVIQALYGKPVFGTAVKGNI
jgi:5-(aminomethyl)-3-furanmethanol phosphate kinase